MFHSLQLCKRFSTPQHSEYPLEMFSHFIFKDRLDYIDYRKMLFYRNEPKTMSNVFTSCPPRSVDFATQKNFFLLFQLCSPVFWSFFQLTKQHINRKNFIVAIQKPKERVLKSLDKLVHFFFPFVIKVRT
jgi:hypothetical protein